MRGRIFQLATAAVALFLISATAFADVHWLQYRTATSVRQGINDPGTRALELTSKPPEGAALPEMKCEKPWFSAWESPMAESGKIRIAFASSTAKGPYNLAYIDSDGDGSFKDEEAVKAGMVSSYSSEFAPVEVALKGEDGPVSYHLHLRFYSQPNYSRLYVRSAGWYQGAIKVGGESLQCMLVDHNVNGTFNDPYTGSDEGDQVRLGTGPNQAVHTIGKYFHVGGAYCQIEPAQDGAFIKLTAATDVPEGTVRVPEDLTLLSVRGTNGSFQFTPVNGVCILPVGTYRVDRWEIERKDDKGALWKVSASRGRESFEVKAGEELTLQVGEPLIATLNTSARGRQLHFSQALKGRLGETVSLTRNGRRVSAPKLRMRNKAGTLDQAHQFQYG